jgi:hypothetical protein
MNENSLAAGHAFRIEKWINIYELVFDAAIAGISMILYHILAPVSGFLLFDTDPLLMLLIMGVSEFCIMLFFGQVFRAHEDSSEKLTTLTIIIIILAIHFVFLIMPARLSAVFEKIPGIGDELVFAFVPISGAFVILGITFGFPRIYLKDFSPIFGFVFALSGLLSVLSFIEILLKFGIIPGLIFLLIVGSPLLINRIIVLRPIPKKSKKTSPLLKPLRIIAGILISVAAAFSLMVWQELITVREVQNAVSAGEHISPWHILLMLFFSGIIPVRILAIIAPPFRPINAGIAVISMFFYFFSIAAAINKLSAIL